MEATNAVSSTDATGAIIVALLGIMSFILIFGLIWLVLNTVAWWKIFKKAGIPGWKSLIPFYSGYLQYKISWKTIFFFIVMVGGIISSLIGPETTTDAAGNPTLSGMPEGFMYILWILIGLATSIISILFNFKLAKSFGKGFGFGLGLTFLNAIFIMILGFGGSKYIGPEGVTAIEPYTTDQNISAY